ncbi:TonB-dependent receptor [Chitinophaga sp. MM2321]|uniref:TonB-dependent receptor n=1 Tax=Chitinophaga sp. MM2321 TaxID=3137178 RepID=UPI0032D5819F
MKLTTVLLLFFIFKVSANSYAQKVTIVKKNVPLLEVFKAIEQQTGFMFFYDKGLIQKTSPIDITVKNATIDQALTACLKGQQLTYAIVKNTIVIRLKKAYISDILLNITGASAVAPPIDITGRVVNKAGNPLQGVSVVIVGTKKGTTTDSDGRFRLTVADGNDVLGISSLGYQMKTVKVDKLTDINVTLEEDITGLNDVVVVGYGTQKRSDITGAIGGLTTESLNDNKQTDVLSALQGKMAGVQISSQSGELGSGFNIRVRGATSLNGSSTPLFVIDGIAIDLNSSEIAGSSLGTSTTPNPLGNINPADIESIEVLKDASATAIYGSRGANGVVLVTTKSGKAGKTVISYDGNLSIGQISKKLDVLGVQEYYEFRKTKFGLTDSLVSKMDVDKDGIVDVQGHNWQDEIYQNSLSQNHTVSLSGGSKTTLFSASLNYLRDQSVIRINTNDRYGARLRLDHNVNEAFKVGVNVNTSISSLNGATNSGGSFSGVTDRILFSRPVEIYTVEDANNGYEDYVSPFNDIVKAYKNVTTSKTLLNAYATYKINKELTLNITGGGTLSNSKGKEFYGSNTTPGVSANGKAFLQDINSYNWTNTSQLSYRKRFNANHNLDVMGAFEMSSYNFQSNNLSAQDFPDQSVGINDISKAQLVNSIKSNRWKNNRLSYITRANYSLMNRYLLTATFRADGSDKFGKNNKWGYFPSAAIGWRVTEEGFMKNQRLFDNLKARLSYGVTGNEGIPAYSYLPLLENSYYATGGKAQFGQAIVNPGNPDLKWEESTQYNAGLDMAMAKGRIELTADYYVRQVKNMLVKRVLPSQSAYNYQWQNAARIDNRGFEFGLATRNIDTKSFHWNTSLNVTFDRSKVVSLGGAESLPIAGPGDIPTWGRITIGQPVGTGYGYVLDGVYQLNDFTWQGDSDPTVEPGLRVYELKPGVVSFNGAKVKPGSYKFKDLTGDNVVDDSDMRIISQSQPKFTGGITNTFSYKNFDLSFFVEGVHGRQVLNTIKLYLTSYNNNKNISTDFYHNRWTEDNPTNEYGTFSTSNATALYPSSFYVEDASYLRLKSLTVAYNVPGKYTSRAGISRARVYFTGNNLLTWTNYSGYDPEVNWRNDLLTGLDNLAFPRMRTFIFGATVTF